MYMTPEELAKENPKTLQKYMQMGDRSPVPLGAIRMAMLLQDRMKKDAQAQQARAQGNGNPSKPTTIVDRIAEAVKQKIQSEPSPQQMAGIGAVPIPDVMQEQNFAGGGIVAFAKGEDVVGQEQPPEKKPVSSALGTSAVSRDLQSQLQERLKRLDEERKGLGRVDPYTSEELSTMYGKEYSAAEGRTKPFLDRLRALEESGRPDTARMQADTESTARRRAIAELFQTRGRGIGAALAGAGRSMGSYEDAMQRGVASIDAAKKAHFASQKLMVQAEMEANKGNSEAARRLVDAANAAKKAEVADNRNAHRELGRDYDRVNEIYETNVRAEQQAAATAQREAASQRQYEAMMAKIDATTKMALARMGGGGGGGGGKVDATYKLIEGTVSRLYMNKDVMESATNRAKDAAKAAGIDRKSPEYGAFVEKHVAGTVANIARQVAVDIPGGIVNLPPSIKPSAPASATPAPAAPPAGRMKVDALGNPI
jgi:hypothetical protein